tara:strand:+ start:405 stop:545 length:141 start_codon:yes stop_codon:yes gene_type:complete
MSTIAYLVVLRSVERRVGHDLCIKELDEPEMISGVRGIPPLTPSKA